MPEPKPIETVHPINEEPLENNNDPTVLRILRIIDTWTPTLAKKLDEDQLVKDAIQDALTVQERDRNCRTGALFLQSMRMKVRRKLQVPDWKLVAEGVSDKELGFISDAVAQKMREGGWIDTVTGRSGVFDNITITGDQVTRVGSMRNDLKLSDNEKQKVVFFQNAETASVFYDAYTADTDNVGREWSLTPRVVSFIYDWDTAVDLVPEIKDKAGLGALPNADTLNKNENEKLDEHQKSMIEARKIQLGFYYDPVSRVYALVAGRAATKIFELKEEDYPFVYKMNGEPYTPDLHFGCYEKLRGNYHVGVCGLFYDIAMIWQELTNRGFSYILENVDPIKIINLPSEERERFYQQLELAEEAQVQGGARPVIVNETDNPQVGQIQTMQAKELTGEFERAISMLRMTADLLGIKLDELSSAASKPLGTTELELAGQSESIKAIIDTNRTQWEKAVLITMDNIIRDVKDNDDTPVSTDRTLLKKTPEGELERDQLGVPIQVKPEGENTITYGDVAKRLRELIKEGVKISVKVNTLSGAVKNNALEIAEISNELQLTPPGTLHYNALRKRLASLRGFEVTDESFSNPQVQQAQMGGQPIPIEQVNV